MARKKQKTLRDIYDTAEECNPLTGTEAQRLAEYTSRIALLLKEAKLLAYSINATAQFKDMPDLCKTSNVFVSRVIEAVSEMKVK